MAALRRPGERCDSFGAMSQTSPDVPETGALVQSEERFRLLVEGVKDYAIFMLDPQGHVLTWNAGAERIKGYAADEIIGQHFSRFYPPEALKRRPAGARARGRARRPEPSRTRAGASARTARCSGPTSSSRRCATGAGTLVGFAKVTRDLTQRRDHEESLRQSEERFRLLVEGVSDYAIFMLDVNGIVASWNAGAQRIKGYAAERDHRPPLLDLLSRRRAPERMAGARAAGRRRGRPVRRRRLARSARTAPASGPRVTITALRDSQGRLRRVRQAHARPDRAEARRGARDRRPAARGDPRGRAQRPHGGAAGDAHQGRVSRHAVARAEDAAQLDPRAGRRS